MKFAWVRPTGTWNDRKDAIVSALESGIEYIMDLDNVITQIQIIQNKRKNCGSRP